MGIKYSTAKAILNTHRKKLKQSYKRDFLLYTGCATTGAIRQGESASMNFIITTGGIPIMRLTRKTITKSKICVINLTLVARVKAKVLT